MTGVVLFLLRGASRSTDVQIFCILVSTVLIAVDGDERVVWDLLFV
jgi:hypothetical protein